MRKIKTQNSRLKAAGLWLQAIVEPMSVFRLEDLIDVRMWEDPGHATRVEHQHVHRKDSHKSVLQVEPRQNAKKNTFKTTKMLDV